VKGVSRATICDNEKGTSMQITLELPDKIAPQLAEVGQDLSRAALEALVLGKTVRSVATKSLPVANTGSPRDTASAYTAQSPKLSCARWPMPFPALRRNLMKRPIGRLALMGVSEGAAGLARRTGTEVVPESPVFQR
jgi:hypothetical protein